LRWVKSPDAPKITTVHGAAVRAGRIEAGVGILAIPSLQSAVCSVQYKRTAYCRLHTGYWLLGFFDRMPAKPGTHRGQHLGGERLGLA
jgi:hypothetical protein